MISERSDSDSSPTPSSTVVNWTKPMELALLDCYNAIHIQYPDLPSSALASQVLDTNNCFTPFISCIPCTSREQLSRKITSKLKSLLLKDWLVESTVSTELPKFSQKQYKDKQFVLDTGNTTIRTRNNTLQESNNSNNNNQEGSANFSTKHTQLSKSESARKRVKLSYRTKPQSQSSQPQDYETKVALQNSISHSVVAHSSYNDAFKDKFLEERKIRESLESSLCFIETASINEIGNENLENQEELENRETRLITLETEETKLPLSEEVYSTVHETINTINSNSEESVPSNSIITQYPLLDSHFPLVVTSNSSIMIAAPLIDLKAAITMNSTVTIEFIQAILNQTTLQPNEIEDLPFEQSIQDKFIEMIDLSHTKFVLVTGRAYNILFGYFTYRVPIPLVQLRLVEIGPTIDTRWNNINSNLIPMKLHPRLKLCFHKSSTTKQKVSGD